MKILRANQYVTVPWRNGGGTTREIAVHRDANLHDDFLWRLSIATIAQSGPFSAFDGVDRTIALLSGRGMSLQSPDATTHVTADTAPLAFNGELPIFCRLVDGETIDLNVMTRRGFYGHTMRRERIVGDMTVTATADTTFIVSAGVLELSWNGRQDIGPLDTIADIAQGTALELHADPPTEAFIIGLTSSRNNTAH